MAYKNILVEKKEGIATITINRPEVLNALNEQTLKELTTAVDELEHDVKVNVAVITGCGKAFIAGADIKQMSTMSTLEAKRFSELGHGLLDAIRASRVPYIAMINGYALGGGCELALISWLPEATWSAAERMSPAMRVRS